MRLLGTVAPDLGSHQSLASEKKRQRKRARETSAATVNGKPQFREALGWAVCGQVLNHLEASGHRFHICWGPESLVPVTALTPAALMAGDAIWEALFHCCYHEPLVQPGAPLD